MKIPIRIMAAGLLLLCIPALAADPTVSNVAARQRAGTTLVDITYDLANPGSASLSVSVGVSTNGGASYCTPSTGLSGDVGGGVSAGNQRRIVWDAGATMPPRLFNNVRAQVTADDTYPIYRVNSEWLLLSKHHTYAANQTEVYWEEAVDGILFGDRTARGSSVLFQDKASNFTRQDFFLKWKANGKGEFARIGAGVGFLVGTNYSTIAYSAAATHHTWSIWQVVSDDVWYFTELDMRSNGTYSAYITTGDYYRNGGNLVYSQSRTVSTNALAQLNSASLKLSFEDTYSTNRPYAILAEAFGLPSDD